jgi:hypothetical protein
MATYKDNWDLRAGFTKGYDLATSAVKEADKQFASAQEIVKDAYALDRTAATQEGEINRMNQENLEKLLVSQERVGDFQSQQEIQRALDSLGYGEQPVSTEADQPPEQPQPEVVTDDGRLIPDPTAPINAVPNAQKPPSTRPAARPMTQIERLQAVEPMLASPRAKATLRNMVVKESMNEARMLATIAPDEAFNGLIKHGVIRGNPLIANDDNITYSRIMPDGKNKITIDRNEAAAWVGDVINKTNNQYKLMEARRKLGEGAESSIYVDTGKTKNRTALEQEKTRLTAIEQEQKSKLKMLEQEQKAKFDERNAIIKGNLADRNVQLRAKLGAYKRGKSGDSDEDDDNETDAVDFTGSGGAKTVKSGAAAEPAGAAPAKMNMADVDLVQLKKDKAEVEKAMASFNEKGDRTKAKQAAALSKQLDAEILKKTEATSGQGKTLAGKLNALDTLIASKKMSSGEQSALGAEVIRLKNKYQLAQQKGETIDMATFQAQYDALLAKIRGGK